MLTCSPTAYASTSKRISSDLRTGSGPAPERPRRRCGAGRSCPRPARLPKRFRTAICVVSMSPSWTAAMARLASCSTRSMASLINTRAASIMTLLADSPFGGGSLLRAQQARFHRVDFHHDVGQRGDQFLLVGQVFRGISAPRRRPPAETFSWRSPPRALLPPARLRVLLRTMARPEFRRPVSWPQESAATVRPCARFISIWMISMRLISLVPSKMRLMRESRYARQTGYSS